ncbi:hypothetical protein GCM10008922_41170 [Faecalicatena contorta]
MNRSLKWKTVSNTCTEIDIFVNTVGHTTTPMNTVNVNQSVTLP